MYNKVSRSVFCSILVTVSILACTKIDSNLSENNFKTKSNLLTSDASVSPVPFPSITPTPDNSNVHSSISGLVKNDSFIEKIKKTIMSNYTPPRNLPTVAGQITVTFKNDYKVRVNKKDKKASSQKSNLNELNEIFKNYNLLSGSVSNDFISEEEADRVHKKVSLFLGIDVPHEKSIHFYNFPENTNVDEICTKLKALPYVLNAYPSLSFKTSGAPIFKPKAYKGNKILSRLTQSNNNSLKPTEPWFNNSVVQGINRNENDHWWWFNKERIFEGWEYYRQEFNSSTINNSSILPNIAVIDTGFDPLSPDKINYDMSNSMKVYESNGSLTYSNGDIFQSIPDLYFKDMDDNVFSHGSVVASIIGAPVNNGIGLAGIAPGANITAYKLDVLNEKTISASIYYASVNPNVDVINISLATDSLPVIVSPTVGRAILNAWIDKDKLTVIGAGNDLIDLDTQKDNSIELKPFNTLEYGQIIVGGTMLDKTQVTNKPATFKPVGWVSNLSIGSNYGSLIDISAGASDIFAYGHTPQHQVTDPNLVQRKIFRLAGTSFATPQVSAVVGMIKKLGLKKGISNNNLKNPDWYRKILNASSSLYRYSANYPDISTSSETKFLGRGLNSDLNENKEVGIRSLNMFNAFIMVSNIMDYKALMRLSNIDDSVWVSKNYDWSNKLNDDGDIYGNDTIWGINKLSSGDKLTYQTYNSAGGYSFGYQVLYKDSTSLAGLYLCENISGVSGVVGANNDEQSTNMYHGDRECLYQ